MSNRYSLEWINQQVKEDPQSFVIESDKAYHDRIRDTADAICKNLSQSPIVLLSGPSGSGKTTTAQKLERELEKRGINSHTISMDNYFVTLNPETAPRTPEGEIDFESPFCMDMDLLNEHFAMLSEGKEIRIPYYMFTRQKRSASQFTRMQLKDNEIAIFEGIHALNDMITDRHNEAFKLYISAASGIEEDGEEIFPGRWMRLMRRTVRDNNFRGADAHYTLKLWGNVLRGEKAYISPFKHKADAILDSSLPYEVPLMKQYALPLFKSLSDDCPRRDEINEIIPQLEKFEILDEKYVQPDSLMREFIGGGIYEY